MNGAGRYARRHVAVGQRQGAAGVDDVLGAPGLLRVLRRQRPGGERFEPGDVDPRHRPGVGAVQFAGALQQPQIAAGLQQVGAHRDRPDAGLEDVLDVEQARPARVRHRQLAVEFAREDRRDVDRQREQGAARHVELVARQHALGIDRAQRVGQLDAETEPLLPAELEQATQHRLGLCERQVVGEGLLPDRQVAEAAGIEDLAHPVVAQQRGVELDEGVERLLLQHVPADRLDLVRRAAVHGRQRDTARDLRGDAAGQTLQLRLAAPEAQVPDEGVVVDPSLQRADVLREPGMPSRIDHAVDVLLHRRLLDAVEVVAHAHVEAERLGFAVLPRVEDLFQQVQCKPGLQVFIEGLGQRVFGRPLGVVALVLGVDAGLGDLQAVHDLHRLQLDEAATRQPRDDDVLRQLRVRPGGRADRRLAGFAEHLDQAVVGLAIELGLGDVEDRPAGLVLTEDSRQQSFEGDGTHDVAHRDLLVANGAGACRAASSSSADGATRFRRIVLR